MLKFWFVVRSRTGNHVRSGEVSAKTEAAAKAKVRKLPKVYPMDMIYLDKVAS